MSTENTNIAAEDDGNLDDFAATLFGQKDAAPEPASSKDDEIVEDATSDAPTEEDGTHTESDDDSSEDNENDTLANEDEDADDGDETPKPKKNRFQERIDEVIGRQRDAERKLADALAEIEKLRDKNVDPKPETKTQVSDNAPDPDAQNEDGTDKYPLGEFDPQYLRDLMKFTLAEERKAQQELDAKEASEQAFQAERTELQNSWNSKLGPAQERYPDFQEKGTALLDTFSRIDGAYGDYLEATLMSMEYGPDVLYYLANNVEEAQKIVDSGARKATIALGRLEARFAREQEQTETPRPKVSNAPSPPPVNKGAAPAKTRVSPDTDDLDAFSRELFKSKRK